MAPEIPLLPGLRDAALLSVRFGAALRLAPFFGGFPVGWLAWAALAIGLAFLLAPEGQAPSPQAVGDLAWVGLAIRELLVGLLIGLAARVAFSALEIAGDLSRAGALQGRGPGGDGIFGKVPVARAYALVGAAVFLLIGGHHAFLSGLKATVVCLPPGASFGAEELAGEAFRRIPALLGAAVGAGVLLSAPAFAAGVAAELFVGILGRIGLRPGAPDGEAIRAIAVQGAAVAVFTAVVSGGVAFLIAEVQQMAACR